MSKSCKTFYLATISSSIKVTSWFKELGCINAIKREHKSTHTSIQNLTRKLQPKLDVSSVLDEWKMLQADQEVDKFDTDIYVLIITGMLFSACLLGCKIWILINDIIIIENKSQTGSGISNSFRNLLIKVSGYP